jgi:hypothetical protein
MHRAAHEIRQLQAHFEDVRNESIKRRRQAEELFINCDDGRQPPVIPKSYSWFTNVAGGVCVTDDDPHGQILRLEDNIEELTEVLERCRKLILISRLAIIAGGICLFVLILGLIRFDAMFMIGAIAAIIGGIVVFGTNTSTSKQTESAIKAAEALRAELIGKINFRAVEETVDRPNRG